MIRNVISTVRQRLKSKIAGDVIWTFAAQVLVLLSAFVLNKILSIRLDVDTFGEYNLVKRSVTVISFVMLAGTGIAVPRYMALYIGKNETLRAKAFVIASILLTIISITVVCIVAAVFNTQLADLVAGRDDTLLYAVAFVYSIVLTASSFMYVYFRGKNSFKLYAISNTVVQLMLPVTALIIPEIGTLSIFVWWTVATAVLVLIFVGYEYLKGGMQCHEHITKNLLKQEFKISAKYSFPRLWGDFFLFAFQAFPLIYISKYFDYTSVSYYSVGITIITLATAFYSFLGLVLLPYVSECLAKGQINDAIRKVNFFTVIYVATSLLVMGAFYFLMDFMIRLFFTTEYLPAVHLARIMILSVLPQALYLLYRNPIDAVSVFPFNTIILGITFGALVGVFYTVQSFEGLAWGYVGVAWMQGVLSFVSWNALKNRAKHGKIEK